WLRWQRRAPLLEGSSPGPHRPLGARAASHSISMRHDMTSREPGPGRLVGGKKGRRIMKLVLTADVDKLGAPGDIVEGKGGYGRNFLLPHGMAIVATPGAERQVESIKRAQEAREVRDSDHANELKQKLESLTDVKVAVKTSDTGKLFGSVTAGH